MWLVYVTLAGLSWGLYVPLIFYGGSELGGRTNARLMAILCVGVAYFVIAVVYPLALFISGQEQWPDLKTTGLVFAALAGVAGAAGAICVIFATVSAVGSAKAAGLPIETYKVFIAPLIFGLAPVINTIVSTVWHPRPGEPFHFGWSSPNWKLWVGIVLVGVGAFLVLFSKEEAEATKHAAAKQPTPSITAAAPQAEAPR
jgi:hypothetical protein